VAEQPSLPLPVRASLPCLLRPCEKFARTRTGLVDGGDSGGVAAPCSSPPHLPSPLSAIHSSGSRGVMIYHCPSARRVAGRGFDARGPAELFFSRNRYEPTTILSHPHRSPTVEVALAAAKVAAGVVVDGGRNEGIHRRSRSESNSSGESRGCSRTKADGG